MSYSTQIGRAPRPTIGKALPDFHGGEEILRNDKKNQELKIHSERIKKSIAHKKRTQLHNTMSQAASPYGT
jgi:hypothetical protein